MKGDIKDIVAHDHVQGLRMRNQGRFELQLIMIGGNKCKLQDFICLLCVSEGAGGLSDDHLLFRMT